MPYPMGQQGWQAKSTGGEPVGLFSTWFLSEASWEHLIQVVLQTNKKQKDPSIIVVGTFTASNGNSKIRFQTPTDYKNNSRIKTEMENAESAEAENVAQWVEACLACVKSWVPPQRCIGQVWWPTPEIPHSTGRSEVQGHLLLHSKLKTSLAYKRSSLPHLCIVSIHKYICI